MDKYNFGIAFLKIFFLSGFFDNAKHNVDWGRTGALIKYAQLLKQSTPLPYVIGESTGLKREVAFSEEWISLIKDNTVSILGWIQFEKVKWLQSNNPEVPSLVYKLAPMDEKMPFNDFFRQVKLQPK